MRPEWRYKEGRKRAYYGMASQCDRHIRCPSLSAGLVLASGLPTFRTSVPQSRRRELLLRRRHIKHKKMISPFTPYHKNGLPVSLVFKPMPRTRYFLTDASTGAISLSESCYLGNPRDIYARHLNLRTSDQDSDLPQGCNIRDHLPRRVKWACMSTECTSGTPSLSYYAKDLCLTAYLTVNTSKGGYPKLIKGSLPLITCIPRHLNFRGMTETMVARGRRLITREIFNDVRESTAEGLSSLSIYIYIY